MTKQWFKRSVYWNSYQTKPAIVIENGTNIYELLNASFQGVRRLFLLAYVVTTDAANDEAGIKGNKNYLLSRGEIKEYDGRIPINDLIKQFDEVRKVSTAYGDDYTTGSLVDYAYVKDNYKLIAADLSKQKALDADLWEIQQVVFQGVVGGDDNTKIRLYTILELSKETVLEFYKRTAKLL